MLILSRRESESVCLGDHIVLTIVAVGNDKIRIGVQAPAGIRILRTELHTSSLPFPAAPTLQIADDSQPTSAPTTSVSAPLAAKLAEANARRSAGPRRAA